MKKILVAGLGLLALVAAHTASAQNLGPAGEGRRLYLKLNCYGCHGMAAEGGMGPKIRGKEYGDVYEKMTKGESGGMPAYGGYATSTAAANIAAYLQSIGTTSEPLFNDWWVPVPTK